MKRFSITSSVLALAGVLGGTAPVWAETRALLVGVSDYYHLDADLRGPANDVRLVARTLLARGVAPGAMTVLSSDGADLPAGLDHGLPERAAILSALSGLARDSGPDDTVVFYFSGHGAQAPDTDGDEFGGYDEILLPADAKGWSGLVGSVENALVDDELRTALQAILDTGAQVVGVIDACHSATGFRALGGQGAARVISQAELGVTQEVLDSLRNSRPAGIRGEPALTGDFVFFYSSQSDQRSFEFPLGDAADPASWYGDFTVHFTRALGAGTGSYAQLLRATVDGMRGGHNGAAQTPDAEGPLLSAPIFGGAPVAERLVTEGATLRAGMLQGLDVGATVDVFADALAQEPLGAAAIATVAPTTATLAADFALPAKGYAQIKRPAPPAPLRLSAPIVADGGDYTDVLAAFAQVELDGVTLSETAYDRGLILRAGHLYVTGADGVLTASAPRLPLGPDVAQALPLFLTRLVRLEHLNRGLRAAERAAQSSFSFGGGALEVSVTQKPGEARGSRCRTGEGRAQPVQDGATVPHCAEIWLKFSNKARAAQDVTVLYVDAALGIQALWPRGDLSNRVGFGESREVGLRILAGATPAPEEIIVLSVPAADGAPRTVLTALADAGAGRGGPATSALAEYLAAAASPGARDRNYTFGGATEPLKVTRTRILVAKPDKI